MTFESGLPSRIKAINSTFEKSPLPREELYTTGLCDMCDIYINTLPYMLRDPESVALLSLYLQEAPTAPRASSADQVNTVHSERGPPVMTWLSTHLSLKNACLLLTILSP